MAVDSPVLYNGVWVGLRDTSLGVAYGGASDMQKHNAAKFYNLLRVFGYTAAAAAGILGNMQTESGLSPAALSGNLAALPNNGEHFSDLTNNVILDWNSNNSTGAHATGLIQWDGVTSETPAGNQLASFAIRYEWLWLDWAVQMFRLEMEYIYDPTGWGGVNGTTYSFWSANRVSPSVSWSSYKSYTGTPENAADIFRECRERSSGDPTGNQHRRDNARYWYDYLYTAAVDYTVDCRLNSAMGYLFRDSQYPYSQYDCIGFVNLVRQRLGLDRIGYGVHGYGTNTLWRNTTGELYWKGTYDECINNWGVVPRGAYIFKCYPEGTPGYNTIPDYYRGDGIGNFDHIGIYTGLGLGVMQSGGYDVTPPSGFNGVHDTRTRFDDSGGSWWTHVAFGKGIFFPEYAPSPYLSARTAILFNSVNSRKKVLKSVKR